MTMLDPNRFDQLPESEVLRRIGGLMALIVERGRLPRPPVSPAPPASHTALDLIADPTERAIATYLARYGATGARRLASELELSAAQVARALSRLRAKGIGERTGRTSAARYQIRTDFCSN
ncbi:MAG: hypothetical protein NVV74_10400 [Magnetospirillum sp.]|nr:hypothetical protein [Magnetospirillum sp.]